MALLLSWDYECSRMPFGLGRAEAAGTNKREVRTCPRRRRPPLAILTQEHPLYWNQDQQTTRITRQVDTPH